MAESKIMLICEGGFLYTPRSAMTDALLLAHFQDNPILLRIYDQGDCDTISWPDFNADNLRAALYDSRETGVLPADTKSVLLPDGTPFSMPA